MGLEAAARSRPRRQSPLEGESDLASRVSSGWWALGFLALAVAKGEDEMSGLDWFLTTTLVVLYLFCIFTVGYITFQKGHYVLGILGIFLPFL